MKILTDHQATRHPDAMTLAVELNIVVAVWTSVSTGIPASDQAVDVLQLPRRMTEPGPGPMTSLGLDGAGGRLASLCSTRRTDDDIQQHEQTDSSRGVAVYSDHVTDAALATGETNMRSLTLRQEN